MAFNPYAAPRTHSGDPPPLSEVEQIRKDHIGHELSIKSLGGLRRLRPWTRTVATVLAAIGSLLFPVGTIINAYVLYLLLSTKGSMVFSERYQEIIVVTPHIRYKTSPVIYVLLGLMTFVIVLAGAVAMFG